MTKTQMLLGLGVSTLAIIGCSITSEREGSGSRDVGAPGQQHEVVEGERAPGAKASDGEKASTQDGDRATDATSFDREIQMASDEFQVPAGVLKAIAWTETRYAMVEGTEELGRPAVFGVMALGGERLAEGARLAQVDVETAKHEVLANIRAAAALLSQWGTEAKITGEERMTRVASWEPVIARYSGIEDAAARAEYVKGHVYAAMRKGLGTAIKVDPSYFDFFGEESIQAPTQTLAAGPDYAASIWRGSPNFNSRNGASVGMVIIHTCEGGYSGCWGWLANSQAGASAHYVVREDGMEVTQLVRESNRAWHIAASYDCSRNSNVECFRNGTSVNNFSIGIEHAGFASQSSFPAGQIEASAKLVCDITRDHRIPRDRFHIVGHGKLQPWDRTDPGPNWPWARYIQRVDEICGGVTPPPPPPPPPPPGGDEIVIDSNNANNDLAKAKIEVSGNWTGSTNVGGFYGSGYWWADAAPVADGAVFWFWLPADATKTVEAHWTAATDRSTRAPFVMFDAHDNRLGSVQVNQQANGGRWNTLGTYTFTAGWNKVVLSRWTGTGSIVVADAVRVR